MSDSSLTSTSVAITFGEPEHGWLPVTLQAGTFQIEFDASDVPINPLELLCEALTIVSSGSSAKVMWNLEPAVYWFAFNNQANEITLEITEASRYNQPGTCIVRLAGSSSDILLPFYNALKTFTAYKFSEEHWPTLAESRIMQLGRLLRNKH